MSQYHENFEMPVAGEMETAIAASVLHGGARMAQELGLRSEMFYTALPRAVMNAAERILALGEDPEMIGITQQLRATEELDGIGGEGAIGELFCQAATGAIRPLWAATLREYHGRRRMIAISRRATVDFLDAGRNGRNDVDRFRRGFAEVEELFQPQSLRGTSAQGAYYIETLEQLHRERNNGVVVPWGIPGIDRICPIQRKQVMMLVAGTNTGKTRFILSDIAGKIVDSKTPTILFSRENGNRVLWDGLVSIMTGIPGYNLNVPGKLSEDDFRRVKECVRYLQDHSTMFRLYGKGDYTPTPDGMASRVRQFEDETGARVGMIYVDYLQNHSPQGKYMGSVEKLEMLISELSIRMAEFDAAQVFLSQLNRDKDREKSGRRPALADIKGSSAIEQEGDYVAFLHRQDASARGLVDLDFYALKTRSGVDKWNEVIEFDTATGKMCGVKSKYDTEGL